MASRRKRGPVAFRPHLLAGLALSMFQTPTIYAHRPEKCSGNPQFFLKIDPTCDSIKDLDRCTSAILHITKRQREKVAMPTGDANKPFRMGTWLV